MRAEAIRQNMTARLRAPFARALDFVRAGDAETVQVRRFGAVALAPALLLALGAGLGGFWAPGALVYITVIAWAMDRLLAGSAHGPAPHLPDTGGFPLADRLSVTLALAHFALLPLMLWAIAGDSGHSTAARVALFLGAGLFFGQISNANAHELIHRSRRSLFRLGMWVYISLLFGHHTSAHRRIHHRHVATGHDPNSARRGESFYAFALRAWPDGFTAGHEIETTLRRRAGAGGPHPYVTYLGGAFLCLAAATWAFGLVGLAVYLGLAAHAQAQLLLSDYVQHYGLARRRLPGPVERYEPVRARHSWNAPHRFSGAMMLNAPRHSDHHTHPARAWPALELPEDAPRLPYSLPVMAALALVPPLWHRVMDPLLDDLAREM